MNDTKKLFPVVQTQSKCPFGNLTFLMTFWPSYEMKEVNVFGMVFFSYIDNCEGKSD